MSSSRCTACGLIHQPGQCRNQQTSTNDSNKPLEITPAFCCTCYYAIISIFFVLFIGLTELVSDDSSCYVELFANSVSVSNANVSAADWRIGFVARSPVTGCEVSIHALNSRLLQGSQAISNFSSGYLGPFVPGDKTGVVFDKVVMPEVITGDVIWNTKVEVMFAFVRDPKYLNGFLIGVCPDIPVKFTTDAEGKVTGSLLGNMRRCNYEYMHTLDS